jgi:hypothetical protein
MEKRGVGGRSLDAGAGRDLLWSSYLFFLRGDCEAEVTYVGYMILLKYWIIRKIIF